MSAQDEFRQEAKSSVRISNANAKFDLQTDIKVYENTTPEELERIRQLAVEAYVKTQRDLGFVKRAAA